MVIKNAVGGWMHLTELGVKLGPGQMIDLDFFCSQEEQDVSKELKRAISRKFVTVEDPKNVPHQHFYVNSIAPSLARKSTGPLRKAVFLGTDIPVNPSHKVFALRDVPSKLAIVDAATDASLLGTIIREENDAVIVRAAHAKLQELVEQNHVKGADGYVFI